MQEKVAFTHINAKRYLVIMDNEFFHQCNKKSRKVTFAHIVEVITCAIISSNDGIIFLFQDYAMIFDEVFRVMFIDVFIYTRNISFDRDILPT